MYKTKDDFMTNLEKELGRFGVVDKSEITADFELHFTEGLAGGLSEAEICAELGDISEIAKQYAEEEIFPAVAVDDAGDAHKTPQQEQTSAYDDYVNSGIRINLFNRKKDDAEQNVPPGEASPPPPQHSYGRNDYHCSGVQFNWGRVNPGGLLTVLLIDLFVLSWAIPALFGIAAAFAAIPVALFAAGVGVIVGSIHGDGFFGFVTPLPGLATFFTGLMLTSLGGLFTLVGISFIKLFVFTVKGVINWHGNMIVGRPVFGGKGNAGVPVQEVNI